MPCVREACRIMWSTGRLTRSRSLFGISYALYAEDEMKANRRPDKRGRSSTRSMSSYQRNAERLETPFVPHTLRMLSSPAWRKLSGTSRRILDRLECEHMEHGGAENGRLPCTYADFSNYGIRPSSIHRGIMEAEAPWVFADYRTGRAKIWFAPRPRRPLPAYIFCEHR